MSEFLASNVCQRRLLRAIVQGAMGMVIAALDLIKGKFALCCSFNYAKVKFAGTVAQPAKFYLRMSAGEVEA